MTTPILKLTTCKMAKHQSKLLFQANELSQSLECSEVVLTVKRPRQDSYKSSGRPEGYCGMMRYM